MVKTEFGLFQVQVEGMGRYPLEFDQPELGVLPEGFDFIDVVVAPRKLVFAMMNSEMLGIAHIDQPLVASPAVTMDDTFNRDMAPNRMLQCGFTGIRGNLGVDPTIAFEDTKNDGFGARSAASFASNSPRSEVGFIHFARARKGVVAFALLG